jgi:hypothetical protein
MRGELPAHKLCGRWRIREEDYGEWLERSRYVPAAIAKGEVPPAPPACGSLAALQGIEGEAA